MKLYDVLQANDFLVKSVYWNHILETLQFYCEKQLKLSAKISVF